ncbi:MAG: propanediol utilization protein, partial [Verrucomicrobiaceae bacterium]|nr:propanediol utilization protein [Verrucomicrobiaceae bacterium]
GKNMAGTGPAQSFTLTIADLPAGVAGTYAAPLQRSVSLGPDAALGGSVSVAISATGTLTGSLKIGGQSYPLKSRLVVPLSGMPAASMLVKQTTAPNLTITFNIDGAANLLVSGGITDGTHFSGFTGWRNRWGTTLSAADKETLSHYAGAHTFALKVPAGQPAFPQGTGYGSFNVSPKNGTLSAVGKLADGTAFTCPAFAGPGGEVLVYQALYSSKGSILGTLVVSPGTAGFSLPYGDDAISGTVNWMRPAITGRLYPGGFGPYDLKATGGRYTPPVAPKLVLGITDNLVSNNATLTFSSATLVNGPPDISFRLKAGSIFVPPSSSNNPRKTTLVVAPGSGYFTGGCSLSDPNPIVGTAVRGITCYGQIVKDSDGIQRGYGFFLLADLPSTPGQTVGTTAQHSGRVILEKAP